MSPFSRPTLSAIQHCGSNRRPVELAFFCFCGTLLSQRMSEAWRHFIHLTLVIARKRRWKLWGSWGTPVWAARRKLKNWWQIAGKATAKQVQLPASSRWQLRWRLDIGFASPGGTKLKDTTNLWRIDAKVRQRRSPYECVTRWLFLLEWEQVALLTCNLRPVSKTNSSTINSRALKLVFEPTSFQEMVDL